MSKEVKIIQARAYAGIDNPRNTAVFIKYYAKGESQVVYGTVLTDTFISNKQSALRQFEDAEQFDKQMFIGTSDNKYSINYGTDTNMTYRRFFHHFFNWAKKTKPIENAEFKTVKIMETGELVDLNELMNNSNKYALKQFKVIS